MHRIARLAIPAIAILIIGVIGGSAATTKPTPTRQDLAKKILSSGAAKNMTGPARAYVESTARGDHRLAPDSSGITQKGNKVSSAKPVGGGSLPNVRVNNPALDTHQVAQTTQSETAIAVSGSNVAVGYNDSQNGLLFLVAGDDLTGYGYSTDGGQTFTDGGVLPNAGGSVNVGDPWLASDGGGSMYFSTLTIDGTTGQLLVAASRSTDGGKSWTPAASIPPPSNAPFYMADKDALTAGPGNGNLYAAWDDFSFDSNFNVSLGLPVAHSTDGGQTWTTSYAAQFTPDPATCSFTQWIGAQPFVAGGAVYVAAEQFKVDDPTCTGGTTSLNETVYVSHDSGGTWSPGAVIPITPSTQIGAFVLAPSQYMRNAEFPTLAVLKGNLYMAWNDGGDGSGHSHVRLAQLNSAGGLVGNASFVTSGTNDEAQPALTGDNGGLHVAYYQISTAANGNGQLDVFISNSSNGNSWKAQRVTSRSFPGVYTLPNFDPLIAPAYMGDYIASATDGQHVYMAWGDNRDIVTDFLWPNGRNDPNAYFAKQ